MAKISIHGLGYVGLVTGLCLAKGGAHKVIGYEVDKKKVDLLRNKKAYIYERGLQELLEEGIESCSFIPTSDFSETIDSELDLICVGTPSLPNGDANLRYVEEVAKNIGKHMQSYKVIATKSTVPPMTHSKVESLIKAELKNRGADIEFDIASVPEFLKEGTAVWDFEHPDRIVVGTKSDRAKSLLTNVFRRYVLNGHPIITMQPIEAEMVKYAANTFLANKIAFTEELSQMCDLAGADVLNVLKGMCADNRIGSSFFKPGPGYGGSCFPKDVQAFAKFAESLGLETRIISNIHQTNEMHKEYLVNKILKEYNYDVYGKVFAVWGLTFKAETDDVRESASLKLVGRLTYNGATVHCFDPKGEENFRRHFPESEKVKYFSDKYSATKNADALIIMTEWHDFREPNVDLLEQNLQGKTVFDFRNLYANSISEEEMKSKGFRYFGVGRK